MNYILLVDGVQIQCFDLKPRRETVIDTLDGIQDIHKKYVVLHKVESSSQLKFTLESDFSEFYEG